jgi:hypothetical protein
LASRRKPFSLLKDIDFYRIQDQDFVEKEKNRGRGTEHVKKARREWAAVDIRATFQCTVHKWEWNRRQAQTYIVANIKFFKAPYCCLYQSDMMFPDCLEF